jgi:hypothetical protein
MEFDLGRLTVFDAEPLAKKKRKRDARAAEALQALYQQLLTLPSEESAEGRVLLLPEPVVALPRSHPIPGPRGEFSRLCSWLFG